MTGRTLITGGPRTGKTTLALSLSVRAMSTDDVIGLGWSEASLEASRWIDDPGPWVIEGVAVPRALRKWLDRNRRGHVPPCDLIIRLVTPLEALTKGQLAMTKGVDSVWAEILPELLRRGVKIETRSVVPDGSKRGR